MIQREREFQIESEAATSNAHWYTLLTSQSMQYGITLTAMLLGVVALGNLLLYRPHGPARLRDVHDEPGVGLDSRRIITILALLGAFDLVLTLAAQQAGGFLELNPLGSQMIESPALLAVFKLTSLLLACWIRPTGCGTARGSSRLVVDVPGLHRTDLSLGHLQFAVLRAELRCGRSGCSGAAVPRRRVPRRRVRRRRVVRP